MTTGTTRVEPRYILLAWAVAIVLHLGLLLWIVVVEHPQGGPILPKPAERPPARLVEHRDRERVLPEEHARKLIEQAELLIRQELRERIERFKRIEQQVLDREEQLLQRIEQRPVSNPYAVEINDTRVARANNVTASNSLPESATIEALYARLAELEANIQENYTDWRAAELALQRGQAFPEVRALIQPNATRMPAYTDLLAQEIARWNERMGLDGASGSADAPLRLEIRTIDDLNAYREVLHRSVRESVLAETRLASLVRPSSEGRAPPPGSMMGGGGNGDGGESAAWQARRSSEAARNTRRPRLDPQLVQAQALPGRRFSRDSERRGWLYINTWYMIGPWDGMGRNDFAIIHPPELGIDFDAVYTDGMIGIATDTRGGRGSGQFQQPVRLNGVLRWEFIQSESIQNIPSATIDWGTYYAYTELYFDEPVVMYVAIGTDDSGKIWINGEEIWEDRGMSYYYIDEHIQLFQFRQGVNRVLVRLENDGGGPTGFSFLICPPDAVTEDG